jgi:hypothetical protein
MYICCGIPFFVFIFIYDELRKVRLQPQPQRARLYQSVCIFKLPPLSRPCLMCSCACARNPRAGWRQTPTGNHEWTLGLLDLQGMSLLPAVLRVPQQSAAVIFFNASLLCYIALLQSHPLQSSSSVCSTQPISSHSHLPTAKPVLAAAGADPAFWRSCCSACKYVTTHPFLCS